MHSISESRKNTNRVVVTVLSLFAVLMLLPMYYLLITSFKTFQESVGKFTWLPQVWTIDNFFEVFRLEQIHFFRYFCNTIFIILAKTTVSLLTCSLAAYGFVRYRFRYKELIFAILVASMLIPGELMAIPQYEVFIKLGWMNSYKPMIIPKLFATDVFAIFMFRQFFTSVPSNLFEAARLDGCSELGMYARIMVPLSKPVFTTMFLLYFVGTYNDVYEANLYLISETKYTLAQGLQLIEKLFATGASQTDVVPWNILSAATLMAILPVLILFAIGQKQFVEGMATTGIKG